MGIIGFGRIGRQVGEIAHAFGMRVVAHSVPEENPLPYPDFAWLPLEELLRTADVVSLHCPLTPQTDGLINAERLGWMKPGAILINTARGRLIVDRDLAEALNQGRIGAACLDVLTVEPPPADNPLIGARNCQITPHQAWATTEARARLLDTAVENVRAFLSGRPVHVVN
jgi:glycerate dehydrogenase